MRLQYAISPEDALKSNLINQNDYERLNKIWQEALHETDRKVSNELTDSELEDINSYIARNYDSYILRVMKDFRFTDLSETFKLKNSFGSMRIISFDKKAGDVKSKIILQSMDLKMVRSYSSYILAKQEELYSSQCLTFKLDDNLNIGCYDDTQLT